jgi:UDP-galactopyranose mutase
MKFEYIVVGSGFAGSVIAERIANIMQEKVLVIEKRNHVGGNSYDYVNNNGILVQKYGPHIFHTQIKHVWEYLSNFTEWHDYTHEVLAFVDGKKVPIPFNLNTLHYLIEGLFAKDLERKLINKFGYGSKIPLLDLKEVKDEDIKFLVTLIYNKIFLNYTKKQWGLKPEELDHSVTDRVPINISEDNSYFQDTFQGVPATGYQNLFNEMLSSSNIDIVLNTDFRQLIDLDISKRKVFYKGKKFTGKLIYTGAIDEFFDYKFGELPYRSLKFEFETHPQEYFQEVGTINYPNDYDFTRVTEFKHITGQKHPKTTIMREYPQDYNKDGCSVDVPCYPIPQFKNETLNGKYKNLAQEFSNVIFIGRLAEYKYYNMDMVVERALTVFKEEIN